MTNTEIYNTIFNKAIVDYQGRQRRFGKTEAQVEGEER